MRNKITVRDLFLNQIDDSDKSLTYDRLFDDYGFIFHDISNVLMFQGNTFVKLQQFLISKSLGTSQDYNYCYLDRTFYNLYGLRTCNYLIDNYRFNKPFVDEETDYSHFGRELARAIIIRFGQRWEDYLTELGLEYSPLHNYDMNEHEEVNTNLKVSGKDEHSLQGFNSPSYKPESKNEDTHTTSGSVDDNFRDLHRYGNIGVTTSQQMLEAEIKLRDENIFIKRLFMDVSNFITVGVYE